MMCNIDCFLCENLLAIVSIILGIASIVLAIYIFRESKKISKDTKETLEKTNDTVEGMKLALAPSVAAIVRVNKTSKALSSQDKQTIELYDKYNTNPQTADDWFIKSYTAYNDGNYNEATEYFKKVTELSQKLAYPNPILENIYALQDKIDKITAPAQKIARLTNIDLQESLRGVEREKGENREEQEKD